MDDLAPRDERLLIARAKRGDTAAFEALVNHHAQLVYNLALRTLQNQQEAEDVAQEAFVRAWRGLPRFREQARFQTWLYRIVTNLCYNRLPRLRRELEALPQDEVDSLPDTQQGVETAVISHQQQQQLQQAIDHLPESYRMLITLRHLQQMSYDEIAAVMDMPLGTVKTGIFRARRQLRQMINDYERAN